MKCTFLGTRGNTEVRSERHRRHSALLVEYEGAAVMIDAGEDWRGRVQDIDPDAIVLTHAHPDHAWGLKDGAPCPVWATPETWNDIDAYPLGVRHTVTSRMPFEIDNVEFEAFPVEHSTRCPAVAYRIVAGVVTITYAPDVVHIPDRATALREIKCYIGDGATVTRSMVRKQNGHLIGHTPVRTQLTWCQREDVPRAIFTHCGSEIIKGDAHEMREKVNRLAAERGVEAQIAHDGMAIVLR